MNHYSRQLPGPVLAPRGTPPGLVALWVVLLLTGLAFGGWKVWRFTETNRSPAPTVANASAEVAEKQALHLENARRFVADATEKVRRTQGLLRSVGQALDRYPLELQHRRIVSSDNLCMQASKDLERALEEIQLLSEELAKERR